MSVNQKTAEIAGGGLAGMFLATALAQRGWRVRVHEKSDPLRMYGAGIFLWENGLQALSAIGVLPYVMETQPDFLYAEARDHKGRLIRRRRTGPGDRLIVPLRIDVYNALIAGATDAGVEIVTGSRVVGASPAGELHLEDGTTLGADLVVGADGVYSKVRDSLNLASSVTASPFGGSRMLIPRLPHETEPVVTEYWNRERLLMFSPVNRDTAYLCFVCAKDDPRHKAIPLDKEAWKADYPAMASAIDRVGDGGRWDEFHTVRCSAWHRGRAAIVGDAAHGLPPSIGQAANLAFSNCLTLAAYVSSGSDVERAVTDWERAARPMTAHVQLWSDRYKRILGLCPPSLERLRTYALKAISNTPLVANALEKPMKTSVVLPSPHPVQAYAPRPASERGMVAEHVEL